MRYTCHAMLLTDGIQTISMAGVSGDGSVEENLNRRVRVRQFLGIPLSFMSARRHADGTSAHIIAIAVYALATPVLD